MEAVVDSLTANSDSSTISAPINDIFTISDSSGHSDIGQVCVRSEKLTFEKIQRNTIETRDKHSGHKKDETALDLSNNNCCSTELLVAEMPIRLSSEGFQRKIVKRRPRILYTANQSYELERFFSARNYPSVPERKEMAQKLNLSLAHVNRWFTKRRIQEAPADMAQVSTTTADIIEPKNYISQKYIYNTSESCYEKLLHKRKFLKDFFSKDPVNATITMIYDDSDGQDS